MEIVVDLGVLTSLISLSDLKIIESNLTQEDSKGVEEPRDNYNWKFIIGCGGVIHANYIGLQPAKEEKYLFKSSMR